MQGPLPSTCGSFWEMVWEQRSRGVVMLNRVIEKGSVSARLSLTVHLSYRRADVNPSASSLRKPPGEVRPVLASVGGEGHRLRGHKLQAHSGVRERQVLLHRPSAGAGESDGECSIDAKCLQGTPAPPKTILKLLFRLMNYRIL